MQFDASINETVLRSNDPAQVLWAVTHGGLLCLDPKDCFAAIRRVKGAVGCFARPRGGQLDAFFDRNDARRPRAAKPWDGSGVPATAVQPGDIVLAIGLPPSLALGDAAASCDLLDIIDWGDPDQALAFLDEVLRPYADHGSRRTDGVETALIEGTAFVARTFLPKNHPAIQGIEAWILMNRFAGLDFQTILDEALKRGHDPLRGLDWHGTREAGQVAAKVGAYACGRLAELGLDDERLARFVFATIEARRTELVRNVDALRALVTLPCLRRDDSARGARAKLLQDRFAAEILCDALVALPRRYHVPTIQALGTLGLWGATPNEAFEEALIGLLAKGGFEEASAFFMAIDASAFPHVWRDGGQDQAQRSEQRRGSVVELTAYVPTLMTRVYQAALAGGRLDVAGYLLHACRPGIIDAPASAMRDMARLAYALNPEGVRKPSSTDVLFRETLSS